MKSLFIHALLASAAIILTNCTTAEIAPDTLTQQQTIRLSVTSPDTRTFNNGMHTLWSEGDALNVFCSIPNSTYPNLGKASIEDGAGTGRGEFSVTATNVPSEAVDWYILYPYNSASSSPAKLKANIGGETVSQNGYGSMAHLAGSLCPMYGTVKSQTVHELSIPVHQLSSVIEFNVKNNSGVAFKVNSVKLDEAEAIVGGFQVDLLQAPPVITAVSGKNSSTVNVSGAASLSNGGTAKVYMPVKPFKHNSGNLSVTVTLEAEGKTVSVPFSLNVPSASATFSSGHIKPVALNVTSDMLFGSMAITSVSAKCHKADVTGEAPAVGNSIIEYRKGSSGSWQSASSTVSGGTVSATLTGLDDNSSYQVRVSAGLATGTPYSFTTKKEGAQLYNMSFDDWYTKNDVQFCYASGASTAQKAIWASANENTYSYTKVNGAAGDSYVAVSGSGKKALKLTSQLVEVKVLGFTVTSKFAAGSLFTGSLGNINVSSMSATINMGTPFTDRPDALEGWACYKPVKIDYAESPYTSKKGSMDSGHVFVLLTDWDPLDSKKPEKGGFAVTPPNTLIDFENDSHIIGYGKYVFDSTMSNYQKFTIPIEYRNSRTPKYVVICGASSALGDYFTGGKGSVLYLDEFKFIYE